MAENCFVVSATLFALGALGFLTRRNLIMMMLSAELMLHGVSLNFVSSAATHGNYDGQAFTIFVLTVAACEAGLALALILALFRRRKSLDIALWSDLGEPDVKDSASPLAATRTGTPAEEPVEPALPRLTPAGRVPIAMIQDGPQNGSYLPERLLQDGRSQKVSTERV